MIVFRLNGSLKFSQIYPHIVDCFPCIRKHHIAIDKHKKSKNKGLHAVVKIKSLLNDCRMGD